MTKFVLFGLLLLLMPFTYGLTIQKNTILNQGNINYIFENDIEVTSFSLITNGIMIDDDKLLFIPQGGKVNIYFYDWGKDKVIGIKSSVPQEITFKITINNQKQYLNSDNTFYLDKFDIDLDLKTYEIINLGNEEIQYIAKTIEKQDWYQKKVLEIELRAEKDENGIIQNKTLKVSFLGLILACIGVLISGVIIWRLAR